VVQTYSQEKKTMAEDTATAEPQEAQAPESEAPQIPTLDLQDLAVVLNLLNIAIKRGTYEPTELTEVGITYGRLEAFLKYQAQLQAAQQAPEKKEGEA
jgi:hypothetical protein